MRRLLTIAISALALVSAGAGRTQLLPAPIGSLPGQVIDGVLGSTAQHTVPAANGVVDTLGLDRVSEGLGSGSLLEMRRSRLRALVRENRSTLEADPDGNPVRRGQLIAIDPTADLLRKARAAGFTILQDGRIEGLEIGMVIFGAPRGDTGKEALKRLRRLDPRGQFDYNHVFEPAGGALAASALALAAAGEASGGSPIGMIDGGVAAHPALAGASIEQRGFVPGAPRASGHGTAVASLLVGRDGPFKGAAGGRRLLAADIYGGEPAAGSADAMARAIGWLAASGARVINISLVGPPNRLMQRAVEAARAHGLTIVAAVGNDGPAAPRQYPASYPGVVAVTGVDDRDRALAEAGRAEHLDFAAPGADMAAALPGRGYAEVRGTSFAAPLVAARFAAAAGDADMRFTSVVKEALPGRGRIGRGIVCKACRIDPHDVDAKKQAGAG